MIEKALDDDQIEVLHNVATESLSDIQPQCENGEESITTSQTDLSDGHGDRRNGTSETIRKRRDRIKRSPDVRSEVMKESLLERNKGEWMVVTRKADWFLCIFTFTVTVIVGFVVVVITFASTNSL